MQREPLFLCIPNFSEGRRRAILDSITGAIAGAGATVMDASMDTDHNRAVVAFFGNAAGVENGLIEAARAAVTQIDLREHSGEHPRFGAMDVAPIVPLRDCSMPDAVALSRAVARRLSSELELPVYLYEKSASRAERESLVRVRKLGARGLGVALTGDSTPDFGPGTFHPSAGAIAVGARSPLVAYNVNLDTSGPGPARRIAAAIRHMRDAGEGMTGVRALGLTLVSRGMTQVSANLTQPDRCPARQVFDFVAQRAAGEGVEAVESELIGIVSRAHLPPEDVAVMRFSGLRETQFIEHWTGTD